MIFKKIPTILISAILLSSVVFAGACMKWLPIPFEGLSVVVPVNKDNPYTTKEDLDCDNIIDSKDTDIDGDGVGDNYYNIKVSVTDRNLSSETIFSIAVNSIQVLQTQTENNIVSVIEDTSNSNGLKFRFLGNSPKIPIINTIDNNALPSPMSNITKLSDYFYADENNTGDIDVLIPISMLPTLTDSPRLVIYHYTEDGWSAIADRTKVEELNSIKYVVISIGSLKGVMFIGLLPEAIGINSSQANIIKREIPPKTDC